MSAAYMSGRYTSPSGPWVCNCGQKNHTARLACDNCGASRFGKKPTPDSEDRKEGA